MISVIIPTYNRWKFVHDAVESVLKQTYQNLECIVVDDGSTEAEYLTHNERRERVLWIRLAVNMRRKYNCINAHGLTRNAGISFAKGEYLAFLDDDDYWLPRKLEVQMTGMARYPACLMSTTNGLRAYSRTATLREMRIFYPLPIPTVLTLTMIEHDNRIITSSVVVKKSLAEEVGLFQAEWCEDWAFWKRCLTKTNCLYIHEPLIVYDDNHGTGISYNDINK